LGRHAHPPVRYAHLPTRTKTKAAQENQKQQPNERGRSPDKNSQQHGHQGIEKKENLPMTPHFKAKNEFICPEFSQRMQLNCLLASVKLRVLRVFSEHLLQDIITLLTVRRGRKAAKPLSLVVMRYKGRAIAPSRGATTQGWQPPKQVAPGFIL